MIDNKNKKRNATATNPGMVIVPYARKRTSKEWVNLGGNRYRNNNGNDIKIDDPAGGVKGGEVKFRLDWSVGRSMEWMNEWSIDQCSLYPLVVCDMMAIASCCSWVKIFFACTSLHFPSFPFLSVAFPRLGVSISKCLGCVESGLGGVVDETLLEAPGNLVLYVVWFGATHHANIKKGDGTKT